VRQHRGVLGSLLLRDSAPEDEAGLLAQCGGGMRTGGGDGRRELHIA